MSKLITSQLLKKLDRSKMKVSHDQLKYWRRNGLMPQPYIRGKGRGLGVEQLWDEACVENVRLILESSNGKRINIMNAGRYLFARNRPIAEKLLRRYLNEIAHEMREKERQRGELAIEYSEFTELNQFLTPENVRNALDQTDASTLANLYDCMNKFDTQLGAQVAWIYNCHPVFNALVQTELPDSTGMTTLSNEAIYRRQRSILAWTVMIHYFGEKLRTMVTEAIQHLTIKFFYLTKQPIVWPKT